MDSSKIFQRSHNQHVYEEFFTPFRESGIVTSACACAYWTCGGLELREIPTMTQKFSRRVLVGLKRTEDKGSVELARFWHYEPDHGNLVDFARRRETELLLSDFLRGILNLAGLRDVGLSVHILAEWSAGHGQDSFTTSGALGTALALALFELIPECAEAVFKQRWSYAQFRQELIGLVSQTDSLRSLPHPSYPLTELVLRLGWMTSRQLVAHSGPGGVLCSILPTRFPVLVKQNKFSDAELLGDPVDTEAEEWTPVSWLQITKDSVGSLEGFRLLLIYSGLEKHSETAALKMWQAMQDFGKLAGNSSFNSPVGDGQAEQNKEVNLNPWLQFMSLDSKVNSQLFEAVKSALQLPLWTWGTWQTAQNNFDGVGRWLATASQLENLAGFSDSLTTQVCLHLMTQLNSKGFVVKPCGRGVGGGLLAIARRELKDSDIQSALARTRELFDLPENALRIDFDSVDDWFTDEPAAVLLKDGELQEISNGELKTLVEHSIGKQERVSASLGGSDKAATNQPIRYYLWNSKMTVPQTTILAEGQAYQGDPGAMWLRIGPLRGQYELRVTGTSRAQQVRGLEPLEARFLTYLIVMAFEQRTSSFAIDFHSLKAAVWDLHEVDHSRISLSAIRSVVAKLKKALDLPKGDATIRVMMDSVIVNRSGLDSVFLLSTSPTDPWRHIRVRKSRGRKKRRS